MRRLLPLLFLVVVVAAPLAAVAIAADGQSPSQATVAACQAEYKQLGADAFTAKYGPSEPWGHCYAANAGATTSATTTKDSTAPDNSPEAQCKAEYVALGPDAFKAKYGATETYGKCVAAHGGKPAPTPPTTTTTPAPDNSPEGQCKAEYAAIGPDAFKAKYGATETYGNCVAAHGGKPASTPPATTTTPKPDNGPEAQCKAEYAAIGPDAFKAKYGAEPLAACVKAHTPSSPAVSEAQALCLAEKQKLGNDAFTAKYGPKEPFGNCVKAQTPKATTLVLACKASSGKKKAAYKTCLTASTTNAIRRR